jgi:hypothetical protein
MINSRKKRSASTLRVALGLVVAGSLVGGAPAQAALTHSYTNHKPLSGNYPGSYTTPAADPPTQIVAQEYPNPRYPNHKPRRGNHPGSYISSPSTPAQPPSSHFDRRAAGVGAIGMLGLVLLLTAVTAGVRVARNRTHDVPLVVEVRDNRPSVG